MKIATLSNNGSGERERDGFPKQHPKWDALVVLAHNPASHPCPTPDGSREQSDIITRWFTRLYARVTLSKQRTATGSNASMSENVWEILERLDNRGMTIMHLMVPVAGGEPEYLFPEILEASFNGDPDSAAVYGLDLEATVK